MSRHFCGVIDFLEPINEYIVSDEIPRHNDRENFVSSSFCTLKVPPEVLHWNQRWSLTGCEPPSPKTVVASGEHAGLISSDASFDLLVLESQSPPKIVT